jgi:hypothetical protein
MYRVTTNHLSADAAHADPGVASIGLGEIPAAELQVLLERFRQLDVIENHESDPYIEITSRQGKFHVRAGRGKLYLYNARDTIEPYAELTPAEIIGQLDRDLSLESPLITAEGSTAPARPRSTAQRSIAIAILAAGLLVNAYTVYSVSYTESVKQKPDVTLLTDAKEIAARTTELVGSYATGDRPGDRLITIRAEGRVEFSEVGRAGRFTDSADTYRVGRHKGKTCLLTGDNDVIEVRNLETLEYFRDRYRRRR